MNVICIQLERDIEPGRLTPLPPPYLGDKKAFLSICSIPVKMFCVWGGGEKP